MAPTSASSASGSASGTASPGAKNATPARHQCHQCGDTFTCRKSLLRHTRCSHQNSTFACAICKETFARRDGRDRHELEQHSQVGDSIKCPRCGKNVARRYMIDHQRRNVCTSTRMSEKDTSLPILIAPAPKPLQSKEGDKEDLNTPFQGLSGLSLLDPLIVVLQLCQLCTFRVEGFQSGHPCSFRVWRAPEALRASASELYEPFEVAYRTMRTAIEGNASSTPKTINLSLMCATYAMIFVEAFAGNLVAAKAHKSAYRRLAAEVGNMPAFEDHLRHGIEELGLVTGLPLQERLRLDGKYEEASSGQPPLARLPAIYYLWPVEERARIVRCSEMLAKM